MEANLNIEGLDQLKRKLDQLSNIKVANRIARKAGRQAMNIVRNAARAGAKAIDDPETREMIYKNIMVASGKTKGPDTMVMRVGVNGGAGANRYSLNIVQKERRKKGEPKQELAANTIALAGGNTRHFKYVELGTSQMKATPFLRPALEKNIDTVSNKFVQVFDAEITKALSGVT